MVEKTPRISEGDSVEVKYFKVKGTVWWLSSDKKFASIDISKSEDFITLPVSYLRKVKGAEGSEKEG